MRVFLDTNIVLDVLLARKPFYTDSLAVLARAERKLDDYFVSALTFSTVAYVLRKAVGDSQAFDLMASFRRIVSVSPVVESSVDWALSRPGKDFEDEMQYESARSIRADIIITRDPAGFSDALIRVMSPVDFLAEY